MSGRCLDGTAQPARAGRRSGFRGGRHDRRRLRLVGKNDAVSKKPTWDEWAKRVYLTWLAREIRYAQVAFLEVRARAGHSPPDPLLWMPLETFLMFTAKVSKMLMPIAHDQRPKKPGPKRDKYDRRVVRGERLRAMLDVLDTSPVLDRAVRDASEHFDERLDDWIAERHPPTAEEVERGELWAAPLPPLRALISGSLVVEVAGNTLDLTRVEIELRRILARAMDLEPLTTLEHPGLATLLAGIPPFPPELRLDAPSRRPYEDVLTGIDRAVVIARQAEFDQSLAECVDELVAQDEESRGSDL